MPQAWRPLSGARPVLARAEVVELGGGAGFVSLYLSAPLHLGAGGLRVLGDAVIDTMLAPNGLVFDPRGKIVVSEGKTLTIKTAENLDINVPVTGDLKLTPVADADFAATLKEEVKGKVTVVAKPGKKAELTAEESVESVEFTSDGGNATSAKLTLNDAGKTIESLTFDKAGAFHVKLWGDNTIGKLLLESASPLTVDGMASANQINCLEPAEGTVLKVLNAPLLSIQSGAGDKHWKVELPLAARLVVKDRDLVKRLDEAKFMGGVLTLPSGNYPDLKLSTTNDASKIRVAKAEQNPVLTVKDIDLSTKGLVMEVPTDWQIPLKAGDTVTLLEAGTVTGPNKVTGDPADGELGKVEPLTKDNKKLVLTAKKDLGAAPGGGGKTPDGGNNGGEKKGSSGGGCDAGVGGLALALGAAFLLKRKA